MRTGHRTARAAALALASAALACASPTGQRIETEAAKALISPQESAAIGAQVQQQLQQQGVRYLDDPAITRYVEAVAAPIVALAKQERPDIKDWKIRVIDDPKTVNAFATGGGNVYVYTGLLLAAKDGAELAGVLAHEMGHVVMYHVERSLVTGFGLQAIAAAALGKNPGVAQQLATQVAGTGVLLAHSRSEEDQADRFGLEHASRAGYDPNGLPRFFETLNAQQGKSPQALTWLSDHPSTPDRIQKARQLIADEHLAGGSEGPPGLAQAQADVRSRGGASAAGVPQGAPQGAPQGTGSGGH